MRSKCDKYVVREEFLEILGTVLNLEILVWMRARRHHISVTIFDHSLFVAYIAFLIARHWKHCDPVQAARAGFLHDLYMYDPKIKGSHSGLHCFSHPEHALKNAVRICPDLSWHERNAIVAHMFPLARHVPRCEEAWAVSLADKFCAILELTGLSCMGIVRKHRLDGRELDNFVVHA